MGSTTMERNTQEMFEVGPCENGYQMGFLIGKRFSHQIKSRLATDLILQQQLLPYSQTIQSQPLITSLCNTNRKKFRRYWDELVGTAEGSGVPILHPILLNFRKEILPFISKTQIELNADTSEDDCSDILVVNDSLAIAAHNEDANVSLVGHTYLIEGKLSNGLSFTAYTYAGELPSCAFGFNNSGVAFTLNSVPPTEDEIVAGSIGRNFISRDLLEATDIDDALRVQDKNSTSRQRRAAELPKRSKTDFLQLLGDGKDPKYPIYMRGPTLHTLCTTMIDVDEQTLTIFEGNPKEELTSHVFQMSTQE
ncbi:Peptidase C45 [Dillenia turbinata]|uniref:Peptidase C45 n=1 Tax=Dillenia turbinata TaxID=194707 RepID=A0AAN8VJR8_9MAGN